MKKILKRCFAIAMSSLMSLTMFSSCKPDNKDSSSVSDGGQYEEPYGTITPSKTLWDTDLNTLHKVNVTPGTKDFIVDGKSEYKIVIPAVLPDEETGFAAEELKYFIDEATGCGLEIITDAELTYDATKKYISVGDTSLVQAAGIIVDKAQLTVSGFRIESKGDSVFLVGGGRYGVMYAVYEFLSHEIDYEVYHIDEIYYKSSPSLKLHEYDVTDVPDFTYRMCDIGWQNSDEVICRRMRVNRENREFLTGPRNGWIWHNDFGYIPPETWRETHPKWFSYNKSASAAGKQLCYNTWGDEEEWALFFEEFMKVVIDVVEQYPDVPTIMITQQDVEVWCECEVCNAEKEQYGTNAATMLKFCNKVSLALEEYFKSQNSDRVVNISFFAYHKTTEAPVKKDENGNYTPIDETVVCRENVFPLYAPIYADYVNGLNSTQSAAYKEILAGWSAVSPKIYMWIYGTCFQDYLSAHNTINAMQESYMLLKTYNAEYVFDQFQHDQNVPSDWLNLKTYLSAKLRWDVKMDRTQLIEDFMRNFYKDAAEPMKKALTLYNSWFEYLKTEKNLSARYTTDENRIAENWPKGIIDQMLAYFDEAYAAIKPLETTNPKLYQELYDRICVETLVYRKMNIELYKTMYSDSELITLKKAFKEDALRMGVANWREATAISNLFADWGV